VLRYPRPIKFFKRKKRKKKKAIISSGGFQKSKFFRKNTTPDVIEKEVRFLIEGIHLKM
jgi:hypothetical protein